MSRIWEKFAIKKDAARSMLEDVENDWQLNRKGDWHQVSPYTEELELARHSSDLRLAGSLMKEAYRVGKSGDWADFWNMNLKNERLSAWTRYSNDRTCYNEVEQGGEGRRSIAQDILPKITDFLKRIKSAN